MKTIDFAGRTVVTDHITSFYIEAGDTICITLSGGELLKEQFAIEEVQAVIDNLKYIFSDTKHI
uniref:Uncharacterized protein n=1 Tax=viral metagenome TaxID=1070528 RepID=A0A6H2A713_9ZZZZ